MTTYRIPRSWIFRNLLAAAERDAKPARWRGARDDVGFPGAPRGLFYEDDGTPIDRSMFSPDEAPPAREPLATRLRDFLRSRNLSEDVIDHALWLLAGGGIGDGVILDLKYEARDVPTEHVPTRRAEAEKKFARLLDAAAVNS